MLQLSRFSISYSSETIFAEVLRHYPGEPIKKFFETLENVTFLVEMETELEHAWQVRNAQTREEGLPKEIVRQGKQKQTMV